jgi:hypothetical protein
MLGECVFGEWASAGKSQSLGLIALPLGYVHRLSIAVWIAVRRGQNACFRIVPRGYFHLRCVGTQFGSGESFRAFFSTAHRAVGVRYLTALPASASVT